jgi:hypothetical protein
MHMNVYRSMSSQDVVRILRSDFSLLQDGLVLELVRRLDLALDEIDVLKAENADLEKQLREGGV